MCYLQVKESLEKIGLKIHVENASLEFMDGDTTIKEETEGGLVTSKKTGNTLLKD